MTTPAPAPLLLAGVLLALASGSCLAPREPLRVRWFRPAVPAVQAADPAPDAPLLRLRPVAAADHLRDRVAIRRSDVEYATHELWRWAETPAHVVERGLAAALFETGAARRVARADAPSLRAELTHFELLGDQGTRVAMELVLRLEAPNGDTLLEQRLGAEATLDDHDPASLARTLGTLTGQLAEQAAELVLEHLAPPR